MENSRGGSYNTLYSNVLCSDRLTFVFPPPPSPQGDFTWSSLSGRSVRLAPVAIQSLSELERARLQEVAYTRLHQDYDLGCQITMPKGESYAFIQSAMLVGSKRVGSGRCG